MKKFIKISLIAAGALCLTGIILFATAILLGGNNLKGMDNMEKTEYTFEEQLSNVQVESIFGKVDILPSEDNTCKVVCEETEKAPYTVKAENGTLKVVQQDNYRWFDRILQLFNFKASVALYLPDNVYNNISVENTSGSVEAASEISTENAAITTVSGSVRTSMDVKASLVCTATSGSVIVKAGACNNVSLASTSGRIELSGAQAQGDIRITDTSGRISIKDVSCNNLYVKITSGSTELANTLVKGKMDIDSTSGSIKLEKCDAGDINIKNTSGRVSGTLLSGKQFVAESTSGRVDVPQSSGDSMCRIRTESGGIHIEVIG